MKRTVVFAYWDKDITIDEYVLYYLNKLNQISDNIVFSSDCDIVESELEKIIQYTTHIINGRLG